MNNGSTMYNDENCGFLMNRMSKKELKDKVAGVKRI